MRREVFRIGEEWNTATAGRRQPAELVARSVRHWVRNWFALIAAVVSTVGLAEPAGAGKPDREPIAIVEAVASSVQIVAAGRLTRVRVEFDRAVAAAVYTMATPYRLVVDAPDLAFRLQPADGRTGNGIVSRYRYGLLSARRSRMVFDLTAPARIANAEVQVEADSRRAVLLVDLERISEAAYRAANAERAAQPPAPAEAPAGDADAAALRGGRYEAGPPPRGATAKPVIVIDPGHGGVDPGTVGVGGVLEKAIVLAVAHRMRAALLALGKYEVAMTRAGDTSVSLDARVELSETLGADLFVSLHADAVEDRSMASAIRGASVYMLSQRASDEEARRLADKENAADVLAGLNITKAKAADNVRDILIDLLRRETETFSASARSVIVAELKKQIALNTKPARAAAFRVLRQPHTPAVLVELGYMSNQKDQQLMSTPEWQQKVAVGLVAAVDRYFSSRGGRRR